MKVTPEELEALKIAIAPLDTQERRRVYISGKYPRSAYTHDLDERYRWDLFWESGFEFQNEYSDAHIYTALRKAIKRI